MEKESEEKTGDKVKSEGKNNKTNDEKAEKQVVLKPVTIREPLQVESEIVDLQEMSSDRFDVAVNR